jgi:predicted adenylyl cyclase CyaB
MLQIIPVWTDTHTEYARQNLELKARLLNLDSAIESAYKLNVEYHGILYQTDTYFQCEHGRLKLREIRQDGHIDQAELIFYSRPETLQNRVSRYTIASISHPNELKAILTHSNGLRGVVEKARTLYLWRNSRIHLDNVPNLGSFLEFEVVSDGDTTDDQARMDTLIQAFNIDPSGSILASYSDLMGI